MSRSASGSTGVSKQISCLDPPTHILLGFFASRYAFRILPTLYVSSSTPYDWLVVSPAPASSVYVRNRVLRPHITLSVHNYMNHTTQETSAGSSWTSLEDEGQTEETVMTPAILINGSVTHQSTTRILMNEPGLSSRRGIHKTIHLPPRSSEHEMPLSTATLMKRAHGLDQFNTPFTPVEKLIPCNLSAPPPAPINKKTRVRQPAKPAGCNNSKLYPLFPSNSGDSSLRSPLAPRLINTSPLASPIHLVEPDLVECLPSPVSEKVVGTLETTPVSTIATAD